MRSLALVLLLSFLAVSTYAETRSTMCQAAEVPIDSFISERRIVGCGEGFPDNLLWHLDRADSISGALDGRFTRNNVSGRGAVIYFIDTGVLATHDEFSRAGGSSVIAGLGATSSNGCGPINPCALNGGSLLVFGHGTGAAAIAAGLTSGIAPDASVVATLNSATEAGYRSILLSIIAHAYAPATPSFRTGIINISGGLSIGNPNAPALDALFRQMTIGVDANGNADPNGKRFLIVAIAGNKYEGAANQCGPDDAMVLYPATLGPSTDGIVAVGGLDRQNRFWAGSCKGNAVELLAPAEEVLAASISSSDAYRFKPDEARSGTSWSAPYVSGMAALLLELDPNRSPADLEALLKASPSRVDGLAVPVFPGSQPPPSGPRRRSARH